MVALESDLARCLGASTNRLLDDISPLWKFSEAASDSASCGVRDANEAKVFVPPSKKKRERTRLREQL